MKQAKTKLPSGEHRFLSELPEGTVSVSQVHVYAGENPIVFHDKDGAIISSISIPGWQLLGADPTALTEEEAGEIVEWNVHPIIKTKVYKKYLHKNFWVSNYKESLDSLAESLGISKPYVILKNVEK